MQKRRIFEGFQAVILGRLFAVCKEAERRELEKFKEENPEARLRTFCTRLLTPCK